jgi:hypothetical protein
MRRTLPAVLIAAGALAPVARSQQPASPPPAPSVRIVNPDEGAVLYGRNAPVVLEVRGIVLARAADRLKGTAHVDLFLDENVTGPDAPVPTTRHGIVHLDRGQSWHTYDGLTPGAHRLIAVLVDWKDVPLAPLAADTVRFTIKTRPSGRARG